MAAKRTEKSVFKGIECLSESFQQHISEYCQRMGNADKHQLGKLELNMPLDEIIREQCVSNNLKILSLNLEHIFGLQNLPFYHKDPFDRLLLVQAQLENAYLVISDSVFESYSVNLFW
jgi:PIN domain nuclease of toxin-antitoxin system